MVDFGCEIRLLRGTFGLFDAITSMNSDF